MKRLKNQQRDGIKDMILHGCTGLKPSLGLMNAAADKYGVHRTTIWRFWAKIKKSLEEDAYIDVKDQSKGNMMPKMELDEAKLLELPPSDRHTIRQLAGNYGVSKSTIGRWLKEGKLNSRKSKLHPSLKDEHKTKRLKWAIQALEVDEEGVVTYKSQSNTVHLDEKWFYMHKVANKYILLPGEDVPYSSALNKQHIAKIMFLCVVRRPLYGPNGELLWDGRVSCWPFTEFVTAKKKSKNRVAGTVEQKPIPSVNKKAIKDMLLNKVVAKIKEVWPASLSKNIRIQQDNATPHVKNSDADFRKVADSDGFHMTLVQQPAKSPDCNINDLGFFASIQSVQSLMQTDNFEDLIQAVDMSYEGLHHTTLDDVFLTAQMCMTEMMICKGHNSYEMPHMGKERLRRLNILPKYLTVPTQLVMDSIDHLRAMKVDSGNPALLEGLGYEAD